jgi:hypothetical protein
MQALVNEIGPEVVSDDLVILVDALPARRSP